MKRIRFTFLAPVGLALLLIAGCASGPPAAPSRDEYQPTIRPADFGPAIDNPFLPLSPGTRWVYEGATENGRERNEVVVTRDTREVMGVTCLVVRDTVWANGELIEDTYDWFAQDRQGNVWYFGEDTKEYSDGAVVSTAGSWEAGIDGAQPGIIMEARPAAGDSYRQEYYPGEAEDMAEVVALDESVAVPAGSFAGCLKTIEWTLLEPGVAEYKYYAPDVGLVLETERGSTGGMQLLEIVRE